MSKDYAGRGFIYVLVASGPEDVLKVGMTHDPLARWSSFHPRWFQAFDLDRSMLVETETRADAQSLETSLHRRLAEHRCPVPLTMFAGAGGVTEWYRGAHATANDFVLACRDKGHVVHLEARTSLARAMAHALARLDGVVRQAFENRCAGLLTATQLDRVHALVESHRAFGVDIDDMFAPEIRRELRLPS